MDIYDNVNQLIDKYSDSFDVCHLDDDTLTIELLLRPLGDIILTANIIEKTSNVDIYVDYDNLNDWDSSYTKTEYKEMFPEEHLKNTTIPKAIDIVYDTLKEWASSSFPADAYDEVYDFLSSISELFKET